MNKVDIAEPILSAERAKAIIDDAVDQIFPSLESLRELYSYMYNNEASREDKVDYHLYN